MPMSHDDDGEDDHGHVGMDVKRDIFCFFFFFFCLHLVAYVWVM